MAKTLRQFLADLATDPRKMEKYIRDADAAMAAGGLTANDRTILQNASVAALDAGLTTGLQMTPAVPAQTYTIAYGSVLIYVTVLSLDAGANAVTAEGMGKAFAVMPPPPIVVHPPITVHKPPPPIVVHPPITVRHPPPKSRALREK